MYDKWSIIIKELKSNPRDLHTLPTNNSQARWFFAYTDGDRIFIEQAKSNYPSSKISTRRILDYNGFKKIHPIYVRRKRGENVSSEASAITMNQSYWYPVIKECLKTK